MSWWQKYLATQLLAFLQSTIKNPKSLAKEKDLLTQIRDAANQILAGIHS